MTLTMTVSSRLYEACQLDALAGHYGLSEVAGRHITFTGPVEAWRRLADDVDYRASGYFSDGALRRSEGLHGRITRRVAKLGGAA